MLLDGLNNFRIIDIGSNRYCPWDTDTYYALLTEWLQMTGDLMLAISSSQV